MANRLQRYRNGDNVVLALSVFIIFILLFEHRLVIPDWLQTVGRLHPLILHLPIVLLLLAVALEFFTAGKNVDPQKKAYHQLTGVLLFAAVLTCGIAVIMGI
ncbi:MAG TPA: cytochrome C, partial [Chryseosolibacter sp.]|nr:cytochrome C [Chryseosolibacter sp.]